MDHIQGENKKKRKRKIRSQEEQEIAEDSDGLEGEGEEGGEGKVYREPEPTEKEQKLTERQELFCQYFAQDKECFGIGVRAYLAAYPDSSYDAAKASAYHLLTNPYILDRIDQLMDTFINEQIVDKELAKVILQSGNYNAKVRAINEFNKVKGRIIDKHDLRTMGQPLNVIPIYGGQSIKPTIPTSVPGGTGEQPPVIQGHDSNQENIQPEQKD